MTVRLTGLAIVVCWIVAMSWLFWHDILPAWTAQEPPKVVARDWIRQYGRQTQFGIYDQNGRRVGGIWTRYIGGASTDREDEIHLTEFPMLGRTCIKLKSSFNMAGQLDEIDISVLGDWIPIRLHGERYQKEFAFRIDAGAFKQAFKIDLALAGTFSDMFRPFDAMPDLAVGQSWRVQVLNPVAVVLGGGDRFMQMVVKVVGREVITLNGEPKDCLVIEAPNAKAWVERRSGLVLVQEVTLPVGGRYTVKLEPYDPEALEQADQAFDDYVNPPRQPTDASPQ